MSARSFRPCGACGRIVAQAPAPPAPVELSDASLARLAAMVTRMMAPHLAALADRPARAQPDNGPKPKTWTPERKALGRQLWEAGLMPCDIWPQLAVLPGPPMSDLAALRAYGLIHFGHRPRKRNGAATVAAVAVEATP